MHTLSLLALAGALGLLYRLANAHPHPKARIVLRLLLGLAALALAVAAAQVAPTDIRRAIDSSPTAAEREADRAFLMIHTLGSPEVYIEYLKATRPTKE